MTKDKSLVGWILIIYFCEENLAHSSIACPPYYSCYPLPPLLSTLFETKLHDLSEGKFIFYILCLRLSLALSISFTCNHWLKGRSPPHAGNKGVSGLPVTVAEIFFCGLWTPHGYSKFSDFRRLLLLRSNLPNNIESFSSIVNPLEIRCLWLNTSENLLWFI